MSFLYSLKRALTFNFLLVASVPVLIFGLINVDVISEHQLQGVQERTLNQAQSVAGEVDSFLLEVMSDLQHVKQVIDLGMIINPDGINDFLTGAVRNSLFFESVYLVNKDYRVEHIGVMSELQSRIEDYDNLDFSGHTLFRKLNGSSGQAWSNTFVSVTTGEPTVTLGMSLSDGFLLGNIRLNSLNDLLQRYAVYGDIEVAIVDKQGTVIANSISEKVRQRINYANHPTVTLALAGEATTKDFRYGTEHYLEAAARVEPSQWVAWVGLDMNKVLHPIRDTQYLLLGIMAAAIVLGSLVALMSVRSLMTPLTALGERTAEIAEGNYVFRFRDSGFVEIDALAGKIASMSQAIKVREESIIANEERFRGLVNSLDGIVWEMEYPSFRFLFVSQQAEAILGYPVHDWYEMEDFWASKVHPDDVQQSVAYCQLMTEKQEDHNFEYRMITADDRVIWIRDLVTVVVDEGRPVRLLGVMLDVTQEKELVNDLARSEQNYREIFNSTTDAIFIHDADTGEILDVNQAMMTLFDCTYEDALTGGLGKFSKGVAPYSLEDAVAKVMLAKEQGRCSFEWQARKANGEVFWADVSLRSTAIGGKERVLASVRDISNRKQAEESLREVNERLQLLIDRMPVGCILWSAEFTVELWNPAAETIFGYSQDEMLGKGPFGTILMEDLKGDMDKVWARLMEGDEAAHSVNVNFTKLRGPITCEWFNTPVIGFNGEVLGVISMVQDISERIASERELEVYRSRLEKLVEERTEELHKAQKQLVQQERLAVLGQLTATVSHEIRNPLGTVANSLYMLRENLDLSEQPGLERPLQLAERNVERCDGIISDLLDFSRQRKIRKVPLDLNAWMKELVDEIKISEEIEFRLDLAVDEPVPADSERLRRVMVNVLINADHALVESDKEEKIIKISSRVADGVCEILVEDNGPGMAEDVVARIFEPMFSTKNFGVGLGVPIIKNIVEGHGGKVVYQSEVGKGTTVCITLPMAS